ncbi:MAG: GNAT family N-acetyltransferase [Akkermansiaceae bacterium]|nr:GNAT family N-acetyltransferase [Armatimonadota bacterium]
MVVARTPALTIRTVTAGQSVQYNEFFRSGVEAHPESFRIVSDDFKDLPFDPSSTEDRFTLVASTEEGEWIGVVSVECETGRQKRRHIAWLVRMYVAASAAGRGVGRLLLRAAIAQSQNNLPGVEQLNLTVLAKNEPAKRLYLSEGFVRFAHEPDALRDSHGIYHAEEQLRVSLRANKTG